MRRTPKYPNRRPHTVLLCWGVGASLGLVTVLNDQAFSSEFTGESSPDLLPKVIEKRNIFDGNRSGRDSAVGRESKASIETLMLVGTLQSEKGFYAFFEGSNPEWRRVLPQGENIAGLLISSVAGDRVELSFGTNRLALLVGRQLRRGEGGEWRSVQERQPTSEMPFHGLSNSIPPGEENDTLRKLMQQREQELK